MWKKLGRAASNGSAPPGSNGGSAKKLDTLGDSDIESGLNANGHASLNHLDSSKAIRSNPDIVPSAQASPPQPPGGWIKKSGITASLKRMLSGKSKKGKSGLPMTVQEVDAAPSLAAAGGADEQASAVRSSSAAARDWDEKRRKERRREAQSAEARQKENGPSPIEILQMVKYLGIEPEDKDFFWVAQEALRAELPAPWEEHATEDHALYYFNPTTKESSWEHPLDGYFRFVYRKMKKMKRYNRAGVPKKGAEAGGSQYKDRELVDLLWAMQQEQKKTEVMESSETSSYYESSSRTGDDSSGRSSANSASGSSISVHSGAITLDPHNLPDEVREIAQYLGINLDTLASPVTVQEVEEMAEYLGIQVQHEGYLLPLAKLALQAPLPRGWEIYKDDKGEPFYFQRSTARTSYRHPADEYFINKVMEDRARHVKALQEGSLVKVSEPWLDFVDEQGRTFWFNFKTRQRSSQEPPRLSVLTESTAAAKAKVNGWMPPSANGGGGGGGGQTNANSLPNGAGGGGAGARAAGSAAPPAPMLGRPAAASLREELSH